MPPDVLSPGPNLSRSPTGRGRQADVSVVIPTFNRADLIADTLRAVLAQTVPPREIIIVDDGSTDGTAGVVAEFADAVRCIPIVNSGDMVARNIGLHAAQGQLVAFCDSDDVWMPEFIENLSARWETQRLVACYANFRILKDGHLSSRSKFDEAPGEFWSGLRQVDPEFGVFDTSCVRNLLAFQPLFPSCMMVDRDAFIAAGGWDEAVSRIIGCDLATALRVAALPPVGLVRRPLVAIRKHGGNISANTERMNLGDAQVLDHVLRTRPDLAEFRRDILLSMAKRRTDALDSAFSRGDFPLVRKIHALLPHETRNLKLEAKHALACLPRPLGRLVTALLNNNSSG